MSKRIDQRTVPLKALGLAREQNRKLNATVSAMTISNEALRAENSRLWELANTLFACSACASVRFSLSAQL